MNSGGSQPSCPHCGITINADARFCGGCGKALVGTEPADPSTDGGSRLLDRVIADRYRIIAKLGEGGMGAVYRAEQLSLKRKVALKVLKPELSENADLVRRFNAEAELAAKLNHPSTVTLYDFGQDSQDGSLFIAMEFIEGESLRAVMNREGPLPIDRIVQVCRQVCDSISDAHEHGIVHRDLKPDNVMLSARGKRRDIVRVLDFGIAKLRDERGDVTAMPMTKAGDLLGTPQYMAPEQIRGESVDGRTDVYAMGAMLYEMVTGRLPFEAPTLMAILSKHLTEMPVPPRQRRGDLDIPQAFDELIMHCLKKLPHERPPSMEALATQLERIGRSPEAVQSRPRRVTGAAFPVVGTLPPTSRADIGPAELSPPPGVPRRLTPNAESLARAAGALAAQGPASNPGPPPPMAPTQMSPATGGGAAMPAGPVSPGIGTPATPTPTPVELHQQQTGRSKAALFAVAGLVLVSAAVGIGVWQSGGDDGNPLASESSGGGGTESKENNAGDSKTPSSADTADENPLSRGPAPSGRRWSTGYDNYNVILPPGFSEPAEGVTFHVSTGDVDGAHVELGMWSRTLSANEALANLSPATALGMVAEGEVEGSGTKRRVVGARATSWEVPKGSLLAEYTVYRGSDLLIIVYVAAPQSQFASTRSFRDELFDRRVLIPE